MFEDLEEERVDVTPDSPDRAIAWAIWARGEDAGVTPEEGWAILHERYPDDPRFLLLNAYAELSETKKQSEGRILAARVAASGNEKAGAVATWSAAYFLKKVERVVGGASETIHPHIRDLVVFGNAILVGASTEERQTVADIRARVGAESEPEPKRDDRDRAGIRLRRFEREVLKELDERTAEGQPLGVRAPPAPASSPTNDWAKAVADESKERKKYAADARYARGELVVHPKFGVGVVTGTEPGKAIILFESGTRKLIAGA